MSEFRSADGADRLARDTPELDGSLMSAAEGLVVPALTSGRVSSRQPGRVPCPGNARTV